MPFWEDIRERLREKNSSTTLSESLHAKLKGLGIDGMLVARATHQLAGISTLSGEYVDYIERLLEDGDKHKLSTLLTCARESGVRLMRLIDDMGLGFEQLIGAVEMAPDLRSDEDEEDTEENADREPLTEPTSELRQALESKLDETGVNHRISHPLARSLADMYAECIQFNRELDRLLAVAADDYDELLAVLLDLQFGFDEQMRQALSDVIGSDESLGCTVGLLSWGALYLKELELPGLRFKAPATMGS
ncbi:MAG TPA: hypothetical protein VGO93_20385 [Candidatus Xenobia bacterium]|jgi:hypothetical protein